MIDHRSYKQLSNLIFFLSSFIHINCDGPLSIILIFLHLILIFSRLNWLNDASYIIFTSIYLSSVGILRTHNTMNKRKPTEWTQYINTLTTFPIIRNNTIKSQFKSPPSLKEQKLIPAVPHKSTETPVHYQILKLILYPSTT